jgi:chromosome segregation ATPase
MRQNTAEMEQAKASLDQQSAERAHLEAELREQLNAAKAADAQTEAILKEKEARCGLLEAELAGLRQTHDELQGKCTVEQEAVAKSQQELQELQEHLRQNTGELEQAKAGLEQQSAEQRHLESEYQNLAHGMEALNLELCRLRERQTAREAELRDKQRNLVEALRENVVLLQASLQSECESSNGESGSVPGAVQPAQNELSPPGSTPSPQPK